MENASTTLSLIRSQATKKEGAPIQLESLDTPKEVGVRTYRFAYDYSKPKTEQEGSWVVLDPVILNAVKTRSKGDLIGPVQTAYGVHLLHILEHKPPTNRLFESEDVQTALRKDLCEQFQNRMKERLLEDILLGKSIGEPTALSETIWSDYTARREKGNQ